MQTKERGQWGSRIGFILAAAGSAIGLGAIWKFPYMAGVNGGGAFLLIYLAAVLGIGMSMMLAELAMGRSVQRDAIAAFTTLGGRRWAFFGWFSLLAAFILLSFYCVVGGWTVGYLLKALSGSLLDPVDAVDFAKQFESFIGDDSLSLVFFALFMLMTVGIILGGVQKGIERVSKVLMPLLFLLMLIMIGRSVTLPGAMEGVRFLLVPDFDKLHPRVFIDALGFACFSLSLGFGAMLTYGSYMSKSESMARSALWVVTLQTICTLLAGFMIMPAVFAFGMPPTAGPGLTYITLPAVFKAMPGGIFFAAAFFALLLIAALTSSVSIIEPIVSCLIDQWGFRRNKASLLVAGASFIAGIPAAWSFGGGDVGRLFGMTPFDLMDYVTSNVMLPVNVLAACLVMGWVAPNVFRRELFLRLEENAGRFQPKEPAWALYIGFCCKFLAPAVIIAILVASLMQ